ncbi:hypothetical protein HAX54_001629 [Datura stramonium]|uniref:Uncharacterized protein n=1 Tax=Datura stramonium TaxID=4076 RepID=A0ABS8T2M9_DATST|nr:hypothetical protein [Datura stramonium]
MIGSSKSILTRNLKIFMKNEALPKAVQNVFRIHKVCSLPQILAGLRAMALSKSFDPKEPPKKAFFLIAATGDSDVAPIEEIQTVLDQVAVNIHGVYVLEVSYQIIHTV